MLALMPWGAGAGAVLPRFYNHSNFISFVRQLDHYGFKKVAADSLTWGEHAGNFSRGHSELLNRIQRIVAPKKAAKAKAASWAEPVLEVGRELREQQRLRRDGWAEPGGCHGCDHSPPSDTDQISATVYWRRRAAAAPRPPA